MKKEILHDLPLHIKALNPHLFMGGVEKPFRKPDVARALGCSGQKRQASKGAVVVSMVSFRGKALDSDNLVMGFKPLRDAIAACIGLDDGDKRIRFECGQVITQGEQGTMVKIEVSND